jgi:UDP-N-acetylglucosamine acyltransferase
MPIHPTAIVDSSAEVDPSAEIGPYAIVEAHVRIGADVHIYPHAYVSQYTTLGARCQVHPFAVVGHYPQDLKWKRERSYTEVGDDTVLREGVTVHRGTEPESKTVVGPRCYFMAYSHVGHNCTVGSDVIMANGALLAGHVRVGERAFLSGNAVVHQFCRVGELAMLGGNATISQDVMPFMLVRAPYHVLGPNVVGLRRAGYDAAARHELRRCYRLVYRDGLSLPNVIAQMSTFVQTDPGRRLLAFLQAGTKRGYVSPQRGHFAPAESETEA